MISAAACGLGDVTCGIGNALGAVAGDALSSMAQQVSTLFGQIMASLGTFWLYVPTPDLVGNGAGSNTGVVQFIQGSLVYYVAIAVFLSVVIVAVKLMVTHRVEGFRDALRGLLTLVIVSAIGVPALGLLVTAGDQYSTWVINRATAGANFGANFGIATALTSLNPVGALVVVILGLIAIIVSLAQVALIYARMAMLVLLAGMLPLAAAFTAQEAGRAFFRKYAAWLLAFVLYKPVAATIYATAFALISNGAFDVQGGQLDVTGQSILNVLAGLILMVLAVVALGALMRFITPAISAIGNGAVASAAGASVGAIATGAVTLAGSRGFGGGAMPASSSGASAPSSAAVSGAASTAGAGIGGPTAGGAAASGAAAGSAAGPVGAGVGAVLGTAVQTAQKVGGAVKVAAETSIEEGPSGSDR